MYGEIHTYVNFRSGYDLKQLVCFLKKIVNQPERVDLYEDLRYLIIFIFI